MYLCMYLRLVPVSYRLANRVALWRRALDLKRLIKQLKSHFFRRPLHGKEGNYLDTVISWAERPIYIYTRTYFCVCYDGSD
jgi:hypothetical protein